MWTEEVSFAEFETLVTTSTQLEDYPLASDVVNNICCYDMHSLSLEDADSCVNIMKEWYRVLSSGPGVFLIRNSFSDLSVIDRATGIFSQIISEENAIKRESGDHFGKVEDNDRIWNSLEKHCLKDPENFAAYYRNTAISLACRAWLGIQYQVTAQVNTVKPGGISQKPHRDYHLGFISTNMLKHFPPHVHALSPHLTLQGAVAHTDMPLHTGPTMFLPYSQNFLHGYSLFTQDTYQEYFKHNYVQAALKKGDMVFFNPAIMHGAGANVVDSGMSRIANLLQVSSAFGRPMETINRSNMVKVLFPILSSQLHCECESDEAAKGNQRNIFNTLDVTFLPPHPLSNVVSSSAEGYAFPSNLDKIPPAFNFQHLSQASIMRNCLIQNKSLHEFIEELEIYDSKRCQSV